VITTIVANYVLTYQNAGTEKKKFGSLGNDGVVFNSNCSLSFVPKSNPHKIRFLTLTEPYCAVIRNFLMYFSGVLLFYSWKKVCYT